MYLCIGNALLVKLGLRESPSSPVCTVASKEFSRKSIAPARYLRSPVWSRPCMVLCLGGFMLMKDFDSNVHAYVQ